MKWLLLAVMIGACTKMQEIKQPDEDVVRSAKPFSTGLYTSLTDSTILTIGDSKAKSFDFEMATFGEKPCEVSGVAQINKDRAIFKSDKCQLDFTSNPMEGILVESNCSSLCQEAGALDGLFRDIGETCSAENVDVTRIAFQDLMKKNQAKSAVKLLEPYLKVCDGALSRNRMLRAQLRNDLATAALKSEDRLKCLNILKQIDQSLDLDPQSYSSYWPPHVMAEMKTLQAQVDANRKACR